MTATGIALILLSLALISGAGWKLTQSKKLLHVTAVLTVLAVLFGVALILVIRAM